MGKRGSKSSNGATPAFKSKRPSPIEQIEMLRNFCPNFSEKDLSTCLSQAGYNMELAAERLLSGQFKPSSAKPAVNVVSISSVKKAPPTNNSATTTTGTPSLSSSAKKRSSPDSSNSSASSRPEKKRSSPHVIPPTPAASTAQQRKAKTLASTALLLCSRWLVGTCTTKGGRVSHQERFELSHYQTGPNLSVRFRGAAIEGNLSRSLSAMVTPMLRVEHHTTLIELRAEALMEDRNIPIGGEVPLKLTVYINDPTAFFAIFEDEKGKSDSKSSSSMFFGNRGNNNSQQQRKGSKLSLPEVAFSFLQWAQYGDLPEIPDFTKPDDSAKEDSDSDDAVLLKEEDFEQQDDNKQDRPEWAKSVTEEQDKSASLPEMEDPNGLDGSVVLRPYQRQALYWMMKREQEGESRQELEKQLTLLSELATSNQHGKQTPSSLSGPVTADIYCDCGPVLVSKAAKEKATTLDGQANPVNHPLWKTRYLGNRNLDGAILFYVNELLGIATCQPPPPPKQCSGGILADDMGLGKTVMLLALILKCKEQSEEDDRSKPSSTLVVAPLSLISQWEEEIETKTGLSYLLYYGDQTKGKTSEDDFDCDIVITSYGTIQAETQKKLKNDKSNGRKGLLGREWQRVILDEAHCIKNQATLASKACCALKATYRWVVTGTIIHNSLDDVFGLIKFLHHEPWCEHGFWKAAISNEMNRAEREESKDGEAEPTGMMVALGRVRSLLGPLMLRRTKGSLQADGTPILTLPPVESKVVDVQLTNPEREFYNALLERSQDVFDGFIKAGTASKSWLQIFSLLSRLRMACDHIALTVKAHIDEAEWNAAASKDGSDNEVSKSAVSPKKESAQTHATSVDDAFITGLLNKFAQATDNSSNSYSDKVAHALNKIIQDNATHVTDECAICLETPLIHEACITNCAHIFCRECLLGYLKDKAGPLSKKRFTCKVPDGDCPVCQAAVAAASIITLSKDKDGGYGSNFLNDTNKPPTPLKPSSNNHAARQVLEKAVDGGTSSKLTAVMRELHRVWEMEPGAKVLIFSQFLGFLDLLETSLRADEIPFGRLDGKMTLKQRVAALDLFKSDSQAKITNDEEPLLSTKQRQGSVMLVSMKAGGVGLNLVAASTVFIVDPWWNQSIEDQCINRVHRIGQKAETVRVRKFVVQDSVEERIVLLQRKKKHMASEVYSDIRADGTMSDSNSRPTIDDFKMIFGNLK